MTRRLALFIVPLLLLAAQPALARIERIWLTHRSPDPGKVVINWETARPGNSIVRFRAGEGKTREATGEENVSLHHVEIPLAPPGEPTHYQVRTGQESSSEATIQGYPTDGLRVAIVADWQGRPALDALRRDGVHLLLTAGDNISCLHELCGVGVKDCTKPYGALIDRYPELFRTTPFMPVLGNHDREIRPRGAQPPPEPVYDVEATAFRKFFELPGEEWMWHFDLPAFDVRFIALDLNHILDQGTTWQTCHPFGKDSVQFKTYDRWTRDPRPDFLVTVQNERSANMRGQAGGAWHAMFRRGTLAITGFGYYAERAEVDGFPYYNTSLSGRGIRYPDPQSKFLASVDSYILLTLTKNPKKLVVELKGLDGTVLDRQESLPAGGTQ